MVRTTSTVVVGRRRRRRGCFGSDGHDKVAREFVARLDHGRPGRLERLFRGRCRVWGGGGLSGGLDGFLLAPQGDFFLQCRNGAATAAGLLQGGGPGGSFGLFFLLLDDRLIGLVLDGRFDLHRRGLSVGGSSAARVDHGIALGAAGTDGAIDIGHSFGNGRLCRSAAGAIFDHFVYRYLFYFQSQQ